MKIMMPDRKPTRAEKAPVDQAVAKQVADEFRRVIQRWLSPAELKEVDRLNAEEADPLVCHTHDFCDANMAMDPAFRKVVGRGSRSNWWKDANLWSAAWNIALKDGFSKPVV